MDGCHNHGRVVNLQVLHKPGWWWEGQHMAAPADQMPCPSILPAHRHTDADVCYRGWAHLTSSFQAALKV